MLVSLDSVSQAIVDVMEMSGYAVEVGRHGEMYCAVATHADGEKHAAEGADLYPTICALAEKVGVELEDGQQAGQRKSTQRVCQNPRKLYCLVLSVIVYV